MPDLSHLLYMGFFLVSPGPFSTPIYFNSSEFFTFKFLQVRGFISQAVNNAGDWSKRRSDGCKTFRHAKPQQLFTPVSKDPPAEGPNRGGKDGKIGHRKGGHIIAMST